MFFQLRKVILWPRHDDAPRIVQFEPGVVNVISGSSKTGKSAVIPIIDYCLGAEKCAIPVGVIREACAWFGVVIETIEGQLLLARREPGDQQSTGDMVFLQGDEVKVPWRIEEKITNVDIVKASLNRLAGLPSLDFEPDGEATFKARPSFRDLMAFTFQPQNIVANPDVLFFKADTTEHREKLKTIFPFVLGAITVKILQARFELERLQRNLRRKENDLQEVESTTIGRHVEAQGWLRQAAELGLLQPDQQLPQDWLSILALLRVTVERGGSIARPSIAGIDLTLSRLAELRTNESSVAQQLTEHRQRLNELRRLVESSAAYGTAILLQRERLSIAEWLRELTVDVEVADPLSALGDGGGDRLLLLCEALDGIELRLRTHPTLFDTLDKEILRQRASTEAVLEKLAEVRREISMLERASDVAREQTARFDRVERFLGRLEQALQFYERAEGFSELRDEIAELRSEINARQRIVSEVDIRRKIDDAIDRIGAITSRVVPLLDAEWPDVPIKLMIDDLTVKVLRPKRDDYLWEIGSGANWLAYHVAVTLALQMFFLDVPHHPVPGLLIYDQPSQVYFPKRFAHDEEPDEVRLRDQDVVAVRRVFALLAAEAIAANGRLQIIVLDHAGEDVWGDLDGVKLIEEWRGSGLVPSAWLATSS